MKPGTRALGIAESYDGSAHSGYSTLAGAVVRCDRVVDGLAYERTTIGGIDATDAVCQLVHRVGRDDVRYVFLAGIALSWYNLVDLRAVHEETGRPVLSVSFEESNGLEPALEREFDGDALETRRAVYIRQPPRHAVDLANGTVYVRAVGDVPDPTAIVREYTQSENRPEPLRVAQLAARAGHEYAPVQPSTRD